MFHHVFRFLLLLVVLLPGMLPAQTFYQVMGLPGVDEGGGAIVGLPNGDVLVGGYRGDSAMVFRADGNGQVIWTRCFLPMPSVDSEIHFLTIGPDGDIYGLGNSSPIASQISIKEHGFWFRMTTAGNLVWMNMETNAENVEFDELDFHPDGSSWMTKLYMDPSPPTYTDQGMTRIDPATGNILYDSPRYNLTAIAFVDDLASSVFVPGQGTFVTGRYYTYGAFAGSMRPYFAKYDLAGNAVWNKFHLFAANANARIYGIECVDMGNGLMNTIMADLNGTSSNFVAGAYLTDYNGVMLSGNSVDLTNSSTEIMASGAKTADGIVLLGYTPSDIFLIRFDQNASVMWAKTYGDPGITEIANHYNSTCMVHQGSIWFAGISQSASGEDLILARTDMNGDIGCKPAVVAPYTTSPLPVNTTLETISSISDPITHTTRPAPLASDMDACELSALDLGPDLPICGPTVLDATLPGSNTYLWSNGATTSYITAFVPGNYSVTVSDGCCSASDTIDLLPFSPFLNLGPDLNACQGTTVTLNGGPATNTYLWSNGSTSPSISVSGTGTQTYSVAASNANGCIDRDTILVHFAPDSTVNLGPDQTICAGSTATLNAAHPGSTYAWSTGATTQAISVTQTGTYAVTVTAPNGCTGMDTVQISTLPAPAVNIGPNQSACEGSPITFDAGPGFSSYLWSTNATTPSITVTTGGSYSVTVTGSNGCEGADTALFIAIPRPVVAFGQDTSICNGLALLLTAPNPGATFLWSTGSTSDSLLVAGPGTYSLVVTGAGGCQNGDTITVQFGPFISVNLGSDLDKCLGDTVHLLACPPGFDVLWNTGDTTNFLDVGSTGSYSVQVSDSATGCQGSDEITLAFLALPVVDLGPDFGLCLGDSMVLDAGPNFSQYQWSGAGSSGAAPTSVVNAPGFCHVTVTDGLGCEGVDTVLVTSLPLPQVSLGPDIEACDGDSPLLLPSPSGLTYDWNTTITAPSLVVQSTGTYTVLGTDAQGCTGRDTIFVLFHPLPFLDLGSGVGICVGDSLLLDAGPGMAAYAWSNGQSSQSIFVNSPGSYAVSITDGNGCSNADAIPISLNPQPDVELGPDLLGCPTATFNLDAGPGFAFYLWSDGSGSQQISATAEGDYAVTVTDFMGCHAGDTIGIRHLEVPVLELGPDTSVCMETEFRLASNIPGNSFLWNDGSEYAFLIAKGSGVYTLSVQAECGPQTDSIYLNMNDGSNSLFVPTAFTPNGDGLNDMFEVGGPYVGMFGITVFDRWGKLVFESQDRNFQWAGEMKGQPLPEGVYPYLLRSVDCAGKEYLRSGSLTLLR